MRHCTLCYVTFLEGKQEVAGRDKTKRVEADDSPVAAFLLQRLSGRIKQAVVLAGTVGGRHAASVLVNQT